MPTATDLVTDLPADFQVFGQAVATSMADLLGGTTGQVLSKTTSADMDFTWVTTDDTNAIQNSIMDAKGDLIGATAADTPARLAVGSNGTVLTADSAEATGLKWAVAGAGMTQLATGSLSGASVSLTSISQSYTHLQLICRDFYSTAGAFSLGFNSRSANYARGVFTSTSASSIVAASGAASWVTTLAAKTALFEQQITINLFNYTAATRPGGNWTYIQNDGTAAEFALIQSGYNEAITSLQIKPASGNWSGGTYILYGVK